MLYCIYNLLNMFRAFNAHHQELKTILVLLPHMVCNALVAGGRLLGAGGYASGMREIVRQSARNMLSRL